MINFKEFIAEGGYHVPVVSITKELVDISRDDTRGEINRNISAELSRQFMNPYGGWAMIRKVLMQYNVYLPKIILQDKEEGEEIVVIDQFGDKWGADTTGNITSPNDADAPSYYLYYHYEISDEGFYKCQGKITDEDGINEIIENIPDDELEDDFVDEFGDKDPRQP